MTYRLRTAVAVAILLALVGHPLAHPLVKECPCVHEAATAVAPPAQSVAPAFVTDRLQPVVERAIEPPVLPVGGARAPPAV